VKILPAKLKTPPFFILKGLSNKLHLVFTSYFRHFNPFWTRPVFDLLGPVWRGFRRFPCVTLATKIPKLHRIVYKLIN